MTSVRDDLAQAINPKLIVGSRSPRTVGSVARISGVGLHTGREVELTLVPAEPGAGILFRRTDLVDQPTIPAHVSFVTDTRRCTTIGRGEACVHTVEHILAALSAYQIDNAIVEVSAAEPPSAGGCSEPFVDLLLAAGIQEQNGEVVRVGLDRPVYYSSGGVHLVALPSDEYRISYTLDYPKAKGLRSQYCSIPIDSANFKEELACCRTFALYEELSALIDAGLIKGGSLDSAVVIKDDQVLCKGGLRFPNEMARHKVLDLIGDLRLIGGFDLVAHVIAIRSGHKTNVAFAQELDKAIVK